MYLVTGGAGFIGSHLVEHLLRQGARVRVLDDFSTGRRENLAFLDMPPEQRAQLEVWKGDIRDLRLCGEACQGTDTVFHEAAVGSVARSVEDPVTTSLVNIQGTLNLLVAARDAGVQRLVFASTAAVYGEGAAPPFTEDMAPAPLSPYAVSKVAGEYFCSVFSRLYGLETVCLRYFNVFGPRQNPASQYASLVPKFTQRALAGELPLPIFGDGLQTRDFVYVENVVQANLLAAQAPAARGKILNVGLGRPCTVVEIVETMGRLLGKSLPLEHLQPRKGEVRHSYANITRAQEVLGYQPEVDLEEGLRRSQAFVRDALTRRESRGGGGL